MFQHVEIIWDVSHYLTAMNFGSSMENRKKNLGPSIKLLMEKAAKRSWVLAIPLAIPMAKSQRSAQLHLSLVLLERTRTVRAGLFLMLWTAWLVCLFYQHVCICISMYIYIYIYTYIYIHIYIYILIYLFIHLRGIYIYIYVYVYIYIYWFIYLFI